MGSRQPRKMRKVPDLVSTRPFPNPAEVVDIRSKYRGATEPSREHGVKANESTSEVDYM